MNMQPGEDHDWLLGNSLWWPNSGERQRIFRAGEESPPESWDSTTPDIGGRGWMRQRLQPIGPQILFPTAWSFFFLIASIIPLIFPDKIPIDDQNLAISFFLISWFLIIAPFLWFSNANNENMHFFPLEVTPFILGVVLFLLHIIIDPKLGWFGYIFFLYSWFKTVGNISNALSFNSARWLLPISSSDFSEDDFQEGWIMSTKNFRNGLIATWATNLDVYSAELTGLTHGINKFIAFSMVYRGRIVHDPFSTNFVKDGLLANLLIQSPMKISGESWALNYIRIRDDE
ncbi:MAG: hypothetical protein OR994_03715 [Candidatus Poseidoniales archaeon]|jgi:hypothetical protein|nr:hypothetical protein [Candidatus Poseidoniales archaeon]